MILIVLEIKRRLTKGETCTDIAKDYNINRRVINKIKLGQAWKHVKLNEAV